MLKFEVSSFKNASRPLKSAKSNLVGAITQLFEEKKNLKKLHNLHPATGNLNNKLWNLAYNGLAKIPDLRKKMSKNNKK